LSANFEIVPAVDVSFDEQARVANEAFAGYVGGWHEMDAAAIGRFLMLQGADLFYSRFVRVNGKLAGFGYITRIANVLRLAGMAIIPSARGSGAAGHLLSHLFEEAHANGDATMMLEVIEQNPRAIALYRRHGFREITRLVGWRRKPADGRARAGDVARLTEIAVLDALHTPSARDYPDIPLQISRHSVAKVAKTRAFQHCTVRVIISDPEVPPVRVHALFSADEDWDELRGAVDAVTTRFADLEFFAPPVWPEEFGSNVFEPLGFTREPITQFLMRRDF
jgi:ribosomal protein S18 acetylase RimI-like enzyme